MRLRSSISDRFLQRDPYSTGRSSERAADDQSAVRTYTKTMADKKFKLAATVAKPGMEQYLILQ
ncbi:MAG: hypothetical protein ACLVI9_01940 [Anaerostipes hadrus]